MSAVDVVKRSKCRSLTELLKAADASQNCLVTIEEAALLLNCAKQTIYNYLAEGELERATTKPVRVRIGDLYNIERSTNHVNMEAVKNRM